MQDVKWLNAIFSLSAPMCEGKQIGTIKPKTCRGREVGFLGETRLLGVRFIYAHRLIESFLVRMLVHLIKNQIEQRLTNSWVASISDSLRQIQKLNLKENKTSYYIKQDEWEPFLEEAIEAAIRPATVEVMDGAYNSFQLSELVDRTEIIMTAQRLLDLTYEHSAKTLPAIIDESLVQLPGGEEWKEGRQ